jgi:hypothetical protein
MSRILRRPMFRGGSTSNEGIMSVPRKGYEKAGGVQDFDVSNYYPSSSSVDGGLFGNNEDAYNEYVATSNKDESLSINPKFIKSEAADIKQKNKTYKALGQEIEEGSYGDVLLKEYLGNRSDPMGKFLINFGLNYMSARPRGGKFGALTTAADAAKKPTEQLYADQDTDRLLKLKLMGALSKSDSKIALEKEARFMVENNPEKYPNLKTAMDALLKGRLEKKESSIEDRINEEYKNIRSKAISTGSEIKDMNKAQILQRDRYKLKDETDKLASTNTFGIPDNITKLPNSTDYTIPNAKKNDLDSFKVGRIYVDSDSRMSFEYLGNNIFRPKIKL